MSKINFKYGWQPDLPDQRDQEYLISAPVPLPTAVDLRPQCPPVYNQGDLGSCTANAIAAAVDFERGKQGLSFINPSRLFIYYNERAIEHTVDSDSGAQIRDGIKSVGKQGVCPETEWPYNTAVFAEKPPRQCYTDSMKARALSYARIPANLNSMLQCLASGRPFVFGFTVYESFESDEVAKTGVVPMPGPGETVLGGHAVKAVGYDQLKGIFVVRNSWGADWGMEGYFTMPFEYLSNPNLADDRWVIKLVSPS